MAGGRNDTSEKANDAFLSSVARALAIVEKLSEHEELSLSDFARDLGVNKNIAFRLLHTLAQLGYIYEDPATHRYKLTFKLSNIVRMHWLTNNVLSQAEPILRTLAKVSGELVRLAVFNGDKLEWIFAETGSRRLLRIDPAYRGDIIPHVHATSKAWLMTLEEPELALQLSKMTFEAFTPHTLTSSKQLTSALVKARKNGFAMSYEERDLGVAAVAAPVMASKDADPGKHRTCVAVISLSVPSSRISREELKTVALKLVCKATSQLSSIWPNR